MCLGKTTKEEEAERARGRNGYESWTLSEKTLNVEVEENSCKKDQQTVPNSMVNPEVAVETKQPECSVWSS